MNATGWKVMTGGCAVAAMASVAALSWVGSGVSYGAEMSGTGQIGTGFGAIGAITSVVGFVVSLIKTGGGGGVNAITDGIELLRPVLTGKSSLPEGAVRVALAVLEADAVRRASAKDYDDTKALAKQFLFPVTPARP